MACDAQTVANAIAVNNYSALSDYDLLVLLAYVLGKNAGLTLTQAINGAATSRYAGLSDGDLEQLLTNKLCG